ncbi:probable LRR receptor-like serine/threonine-protein kinase At3g47570 [Musa acuminata AAA Group]|uniref:probable LRR receptor-like serine/threonine-protein kinase At3g47570 n=1 Tax=Musa acuminata AAA Group TaxID=214697 RepID=UPI0031D9F9D7
MRDRSRHLTLRHHILESVDMEDQSRVASLPSSPPRAATHATGNCLYILPVLDLLPHHFEGGAMELPRVLLTSQYVRILLLLFLHSLFCLCHSATVDQPSGSETDRAALLAVRAAITEDPRGIMNSWNNTVHFCQWPGVACDDPDHRERVTTLALESKSLRGVISPSIGNLTYLGYLQLSNNSFYGEIPPEISRLAQLKDLNLSYNALNGTVPVSLGLCTNLLGIDFTGNLISGNIPAQLGSLLKLLVLNLGVNKLVGDITPFLGNLSSLLQLDLSSNNLTAEIPSSLGKLSNLTYLDLSANNLVGGIPPSLGKLSSIRMLDLAGNRLSGSITPDMANLLTLEFLDLSNNSLSGEIPPLLGRVVPLQYLLLYNNNLTGSLPNSLGNLASLIYLYLSSNSLSGTIPPSITNLSSLQVLALSSNKLGGRLPEEIGRLTRLEFFQVSENGFSGSVPLSLYNITSLQTLSMASNQLSGTLPLDIGDTLPNLSFLGMASNRLEGQIPWSLANATSLRQIDLSRNNFSGRIPANLGNLPYLNQVSLGNNSLEARDAEDWEFISSLTNCSQLEELSLIENDLGGVLPASIANLSIQLKSLTLGRNHISGSFPPGIRNFVNLDTLSLNENHFTGSIPDFLGELVNLEALILHGNKFSGNIPFSIGKLTRLSELALYDNDLGGSIPVSLGNCQNLNYLDLSGNRLSGSIPIEVLSIGSLSSHIDLSNNQLNGTLPPEVGRLRNTPFLSVAINRLSGGIPTTLGDCQLLESLNLSRNFFQGSIPTSLSNLKGIKRLDLSSNNLSGSFPDFLAGLPDLQLLNLSFNDLNGEVPVDKIFSNSSEFYVVGNHKLCGGISSLHLPSCSTQASKKNRSLILEITLPIVISLLLFALFMTCCYARKHKKLGLPAKVLENVPTRLSYLELMKATDDFSSENLIGVGSYGSVYRGVLGDGKTLVAIKVLNLVQRGAFKAFVAECEALRSIRHRNLVKILTTCSSVDLRGNEFRAIVFDFMPNGSLESWLHPDTDRNLYSKRLGLLRRLDIAIDVAAAVSYLHDHCETPIIHCDLKPSNVLLDGNMTARVGDFGLARFLSNGTDRYLSSSVAMKGSIGYMAPEYGMDGQVSTHADVYSYGVLLLELFTGRRPTDDMFKDGLTLQKHVEGAFTKGAQVTGIADPSLFSDEEEGKDTSVLRTGSQASERITRCLESVLMVGLCCAKESPRERVTIKDAVTRIETIKSLLLTPKM